MKLGYFSSQRKLEKLSYDIKHYTSQSKLLTLQKYLDCPIFGGNPDPSSCPIHSTLNSKNICACDSQFYPIFEDLSKEGIIKSTKNNTFLCGTKSAQMQSVGEYLYGSQVYYNLEKNNYSCNIGYVFSSPEESKGKCILADTKNTSISFKRTLKKGMSGDDVKQLQTSLQKLGYLSKAQTPSTYFGVITKNALVKLQKENKITPANGVFSSSTQIIITSLTNSF